MLTRGRMNRAQPLAVPLALSAFVLLGACATIQATAPDEPSAGRVEPAKAVEVASVEGITEYRLPNGLRFLLFPDRSKQQITVNITYMVGSRHEGYGETGMAHLLEHLVFKGSTDHPNIDDELSEHGAFANGTTWFDRTNYYEDLPGQRRQLGLGAGPGIGSHGQLFHRRRRSRIRDDRRAQRVGGRRKRAFERARRPRSFHRLSLAQLRQLHHRRPFGHRKRADRPAPSLLPQVLPARQRRARGGWPLRPATSRCDDRGEVRHDSTPRTHRRQSAIPNLQPPNLPKTANAR